MFSQCWLYTRVAQRSYYVLSNVALYNASCSKVILCFPNVELYTRVAQHWVILCFPNVELYTRSSSTLGKHIMF